MAHHLLKSQRIRRVAAQALFVGLVLSVVVSFTLVAQHNIQAQGMSSGFGFLERTTGWPMSFSVVETSARSTYAWVLFAGLLNTMLVGFLALFLATVLGTAIAFMRLSGNMLARFVGGCFVELFRNVPLILQVVFWYAILTHLPRPRDAVNVADLVFLSNRGLMLPAPVLSLGDLVILVGAALVYVVAFVALRGSARPRYLGIGGLAALGALFVVVWLTGRSEGVGLLSVPELAGLRFVGGVALKPEFSALLIGMTLFGASYIGEIIRGGLLSVETGKLEAGKALGLSPWQVNSLIRMPLALRAMLPALSNQYIWLMKATTLGIAIGFPDFFGIVSTSINQSGQTLELIAILMLGFIVINYSMGFILNRINSHLKLKGRT